MTTTQDDGKVLAHLRPRWRERGPAADGGDTIGKHWRLAWSDDRVAWLTLDVDGANANTLSADVISELDEALSRLEGAGPAKGLMIRSGKDAGFAAGADIREFAGAQQADQVAASLSEAHRVIDRVAALDFPTIAVIHGHCLGGGLELALACRYRIAVPGASLGFPEVRLGLHPGLGGTFRSIGLMGPVEAMSMMLTGRNLSARRAHRLGLVDVVVEERHVASAVDAAIAGRVKRNTGRLHHAALALGPARQVIAGRMRKRTASKAREAHYPAPFALIELWREHGGDSQAMQRAEIASFAKLLVSDTSRNLTRVFFLHQRLKALGGDGDPPQQVHVVGAGTMGADIAAWCALQGMRVTLADRDPKVLARAMASAASLFDSRCDDSAGQRDARDRLVPDFAGDGVRGADLVIEAVPEDTEIKLAVYRDVEPRMKDGALLASNTSSIPLTELRDKLERPEAFVGLHFFNPVAKMMLVEIVRHDTASQDTLDTANAFATAIGKLPVPVDSAPGFLVNRALMPYLLEAMVMLDEGTAPETLDRVAEDFGMPMGPAELADRVGLDICLHVADVLREAIDRPMPEVPKKFRDLVEQGHLGRKTGSGIYRYEDGKPRKDDGAASPEEGMTDRLVLPLVDACVACLRTGVCADADLVDAAMIFGTGFAPFRGGPLHYARRRGIDDITAALSRLAQRHGEHLEPDEGWSRLDEWM